MSDDFHLRFARPADVSQIAGLIEEFAAQHLLLPRSAHSIALGIDDFVVAVDPRQRVRACGALKEYSPSVAEVASLAVTASAHGQGVGGALVRRLETLARGRGIHELFALTLAPGFFSAIGYDVVERARFPEKEYRDCVACPRRHACDEICLHRSLRAAALAA